MRIIDAINAADAVQQNEISQSVKVGWLSALDGQLVDSVCNTHEGLQHDPIVYNDETDIEATELLVPAPYDELYIGYLVMRIQLDLQEIERYNNTAAVYQEALRRYENQINRTWLPIGVGALRF